MPAAAAAAALPAWAAETVTYSYDARGWLVQVVRTGSVNNRRIWKGEGWYHSHVGAIDSNGSVYYVINLGTASTADWQKELDALKRLGEDVTEIILEAKKARARARLRFRFERSRAEAHGLRLLGDALQTIVEAVIPPLNKGEVEPFGCFGAGTLVSTPNGLTQIENIFVGDLFGQHVILRTSLSYSF